MASPTSKLLDQSIENVTCQGMYGLMSFKGFKLLKRCKNSKQVTIET